MYYVYVLRSLRNAKRYIGFTGKEPKIRLDEHNQGLSQWTRTARPLELIFVEEFADPEIAQRREKFFKTGKGSRVLTSLLTDKTCARSSISPTTTLGDPPKP